MLHKHYPELGECCSYNEAIATGFLKKNIDLYKLVRFVKYDARLTDTMIARMSDASYYTFLNDLYDHIKNNEDMIEFWLL